MNESVTDAQFARFPRGFVYLDGKHYKIYRAIIDRARSQERQKDTETYYESHHIVPKSYDSDHSPANRVLLTAREHYICHLLLWKMFANVGFRRKMTRAIAFFRNRDIPGEPSFTSRSFELAKIAQAKGMRGNKLAKGHKQSPEHIRKRFASFSKTIEKRRLQAA